MVWEEGIVTEQINSVGLIVLRIRADDSEAQWKLGMKFSCTIPEGKILLSTAKSLNIIGVCMVGACLNFMHIY